MSRYEFKLPDIGEGVTEGEIVEWHVAAGDQVQEDQPMVEVMTDKATVTITSPKTGRVVETRGKKGEVVAVHAVLVVYDLGGSAGDTAAPAAAAPARAEGPAATAVGDIKESLPGMGMMVATVGATAAKAPAIGGAFEMAGQALSTHNPGTNAGPAIDHSSLSMDALREGVDALVAPQDDSYHAPDGKALATPATRKLARDLGVDLRKVRPSSESGRVSKEDVRAYVLTQQSKSAPRAASPSPFASVPTASGPFVPSATAAAPAAPPVAPPVAPPAAQTETAASKVVDELARPGARENTSPTRAPVSIAPVTSGKGEPLEERVPFRGMRRRIAEKMHNSVSTAAHFTFVEECDTTALKALRDRLRPKAEKRGVKLTFLPFICKAVVAALKKHKILNTALDESTSELVYRKYYNLGIATSTDNGLMVPVVKNADGLSLLDTAREIDRVANAARSGKASLEDLQGSTFTITSLGAQGGLFATPIINFPEVAILGVHQIKQKPVVRDGQIVIGDVMLLSLSFDHRIIDGHIGAAFAYEIINALQDPDQLVLDL